MALSIMIPPPKKKRIEFYDYYDHFKSFGFTWEHKPLQLKYKITLSSEEKTLTKKIMMTHLMRTKIANGKSRTWLANNNNNLLSISSEYIKKHLPLF